MRPGGASRHRGHQQIGVTSTGRGAEKAGVERGKMEKSGMLKTFKAIEATHLMKDMVEHTKDEEVQLAIARTNQVLGKMTSMDRHDPRFRRWQIDKKAWKDAEAAKSSFVKDLAHTTDIPLASTSFGDVIGYKDTPIRAPALAPVKPPWNYEREEKAMYKTKRRGRQEERPEEEDKDNEVPLTRELKHQIQQLDSKIQKIEKLRKGPPNVAKRHGDAALRPQNFAKDDAPREGGRWEEDVPSAARSRSMPGKSNANMRPHLRTTNAKVKELMDNSNSKCVAELQSKFRKLLADEIRKIESLEDMPMETKKLLRKHIKSLIMRRVEVEVEKKKLFEWPEEAVKKYANDHIKAEIERRKQEREAEAAAERALAASKSFRRGVTATRAAVKFTSDHHQPPALQPLELPASPEKPVSRGHLGSRGSLPSRSSLRAPGTPLGVIIEEADKASPMQVLPEEDEVNAEEAEKENAEITAKVVEMLSGHGRLDAEFLGSLIRLRLNAELIGSKHVSPLQQVLQLCSNLRVLELAQNDLGASSFQGIMSSMYRAERLPLEELDLSQNCLGADNGASVAHLTVYLGKAAARPGMAGHCIKRLLLRACMLGDAGTMVLATALPSAPTIQELDLSENGIGDSGVRVLGRTLGQGLNRRLGWLNLAYNNIGPMGCHWLGVALEVQPSGLRILNLSWNANIGLRGFDRIAQSLASNTALEELHMEACELGDASVDVIVLLSSLNTTMRVLHIQTNNLTLHGKRRLWRLLKLQNTPVGSCGSEQAPVSPGSSGSSLTIGGLNRRVAANFRLYSSRQVLKSLGGDREEDVKDREAAGRNALPPI